MAKPFTEQEIETIVRLFGTVGVASIARKMDRSENSVYNKYMEIVRNGRHRAFGGSRGFQYLLTILNGCREHNFIILTTIRYDPMRFYRTTGGDYHYAVCALSDGEFNALFDSVPNIEVDAGQDLLSIWKQVETLINNK